MMLKSMDFQRATTNHLLRSFLAEERLRLSRTMRHATLPIGQVLCEPGERSDHVYFPTTCLVSYIYTTSDGATAEIALVGNDGVIGVPSFLGGDTIPHRAIVQIGGDSLKVPAKVLREEFAKGGLLQEMLLRYTQALITQVAQTAVCNRLHSVEQRLCRWLLLCHDRIGGSEILMTQEYIASMLGGRRESVTVAAGHLQNAGLIHYSRGHIQIVNRQGLEAAACECYHVVERELSRLLEMGPIKASESGRGGTRHEYAAGDF
jgi:CRP-like cAMP-binding protein